MGGFEGYVMTNEGGSADRIVSDVEPAAHDGRGARASGPHRSPSRRRSVVKAVTYRAFIVCLDFLAIYLFTGKVEVALGFMIVSNVYTTVGYFLHERLWAHIRWGTEPATR
jgi:uncharacterized membrane protein